MSEQDSSFQEPDSSENLWATTSDGALLQQLFGYQPTLHDAIIQDVKFENGVLELTVMYSDLPEDGEKELRVRFSMIFAGSVVAELDLDSADICDFSMSRQKGRLQADFLYYSGEFGRVRADKLDVVLWAVDPLAEVGPRRLKIC